MTAKEFLVKENYRELLQLLLKHETGFDFMEAYAKQEVKEAQRRRVSRSGEIMRDMRGEISQLEYKTEALQKKVEELKEEVNGYKTANELMKQALKE
jgi:uncharacterized protein YlxW (UPF0749 family)